MARRAREHRKDIPGYDETRPPRDERKREHRRVRHAANQMLHQLDDPEDLTLPDVRRRRHDDSGGDTDTTGSNRFRVWKTKFWKRREGYQDMKARLDAEWPVITPHQLGDG